jgi:hypothetical protein
LIPAALAVVSTRLAGLRAEATSDFVCQQASRPPTRETPAWDEQQKRHTARRSACDDVRAASHLDIARAEAVRQIGRGETGLKIAAGTYATAPKRDGHPHGDGHPW